jgi:predicted negative regulator of RcsB-dependent stress response
MGHIILFAIIFAFIGGSIGGGIYYHTAVIILGAVFGALLGGFLGWIHTNEKMRALRTQLKVIKVFVIIGAVGGLVYWLLSIIFIEFYAWWEPLAFLPLLVGFGLLAGLALSSFVKVVSAIWNKVADFIPIFGGGAIAAAIVVFISFPIWIVACPIVSMCRFVSIKRKLRYESHVEEDAHNTDDPGEKDEYEKLFERVMLEKERRGAKKAFDYINNCIKNNTNPSVEYAVRGELNAELENYQEAVDDYTKAISVSPDFTMAYFCRGTAYMETDNFQNAIEDFNKAIEIIGSDPELVSTASLVYYFRGECYEELGRTQDAIEDYEKSLYFDPDSDVAEDIRESIENLKRKG